jgi:hypothetical protein
MSDYRRRLYLVLLAWIVVAVQACGPREPPEPEAPPPPPPPTPEQIAEKIITELGLNAPLPPAGATQTVDEAQAFKTGIQRARGSNSSTPEGKRALQIVSSRLDQRIQALESNRLWEHTLTGIEGYEVLNPGSPKWSTTKEVAIAEMKKPKVTIVGFMASHGQDAAVLEFYLPVQKTTERKQVRVGEEFFGLTLVEIIGDNQGVRLEYGETGQTFDVLTRSARR